MQVLGEEKYVEDTNRSLGGRDQYGGDQQRHQDTTGAKETQPIEEFTPIRPRGSQGLLILLHSVQSLLRQGRRVTHHWVAEG